MKNFRLPGLTWGALLVALPLLSVWLETYFGAYGWAPAVAGLLVIIARVIEAMQAKPALPDGVAASAPETQRSLWWG